MRGYVSFIIRHRYAVLVVLALLTGLASWSFSRGVAATSMGTLFLGEDPRYEEYKKKVARFGSEESTVVAFESPDLFSPDVLTRLGQVVERLKMMPDVASVQSIFDAHRIAGSPTKIEITRYAEAALADPSRADELMAEMLEDPLARGVLVSDNGRHTAIIVEHTFDETRPAERNPLMVAEIVEVFHQHGFGPEIVHTAGIVVVLSEVVTQTQFNLRRLFPIVLVLLLIVVWIMFRRLWPVFITGLAATIAVIWTMGFAVQLDHQINILMAMVPAVVLIISFSDVIHLCSAYLLELSRGCSKEEAIELSGADVGLACIYTSATTFAGFVSLSFIPTPIFRHMGVVLGFGVAVALLLAMTLAPIMFTLMRQPKPWKTGTASRVQGALDNLLAWTERTVTGYPKATIGVFVVLAGVAVYGTFQLHIDTDFNKRLDEDNKVRMDQAYFESHFSGTNSLELYVDGAAEDALLDPAFFARLVQFERDVEQLEGVDQVLSITDAVETVHRQFGQSKDRPFPPQDRKALAQYLLLLEISDKDGNLDRLADYDRQHLRLIAKVPQSGVRHAYNVGEKAWALGKGLREDGATVTASGSLYLTGGWLDQLLDGQKNGLLAAFVMIAIMMAIGLRSVRWGLWSMIPNVLPILALGGYVGLLWDATDSDTIALAILAIGIGVDDTIHFLMRFRLESQRCDSVEEALSRTFNFSGRAIGITSVVLLVGFAPFFLSDYFPLQIMGYLLPYCLFVALVADLCLVPAMATLGLFRFPGRAEIDK
jgi:uncharacterized protein